MITLRERLITLAGQITPWPVQPGFLLERHGIGYGAWTLVPPLSERSIIYSFGIGTDLSFDLSLIQKYRSSVFAFDPTPRSLDWLSKQTLPTQIKTYQLGIGPTDGVLRLSAPRVAGHSSFQFKDGVGDCQFPCLTYDSIRAMLGHDSVDLLKMDIEGSEFKTIPSILGSKSPPLQILVEYHHRNSPHNLASTKNSVNAILSRGYRLAAVSKRAEEFSFIFSNATS